MSERSDHPRHGDIGPGGRADGTHPDELQLTALAIGEEDASVLAHVGSCAACQQVLDSTRRTVAALEAPDPLQAPPPELWDRIAADIDADGGTDIDRDRDRDRDTVRHSDRHSDIDPGSRTSVIELQPRRRRWFVPAAAAVAGLVIGATAVGLGGPLLSPGQQPVDPPTTPPPVALGDAQLEPVASSDLTGQAELVRHADGSMELILDVSSTPDPSDGYLEVWLRDQDATRLISLGTVTSTTTSVMVPEGIDLAQYPVLDVSHEHFDGDPSHSGDTLAAGPLRPTEE